MRTSAKVSCAPAGQRERRQHETLMVAPPPHDAADRAGLGHLIQPGRTAGSAQLSRPWVGGTTCEPGELIFAQD